MALSIAIAVIAGLALTGCGSSSTASGSASPTQCPYSAFSCDSSPNASASEQDGIGQMACDHFRNVMNDEANGLLTDSELRDKMKQVYGDSQGSTTTGLAVTSMRMFADVTQGDSLTFMSDAASFSNDCKSIGH